jgi:ubiquinone/menaquinone biosynthesis C-methylase UbiE
MKESDHLSSNREKWNKWAEKADGNGLMFEYLRNAQSNLISILNIKENQNFLDIGCGTGWAVGQVARVTGNKGSFYGIDLSPKMIEKAKENFNGNDNFHFYEANSESIPLEDNFFDIIICTNSFHHYLHPEIAMKEIHRVLKTGGEIFILDPTADIWFIKIIDKIIKLFERQHVKFYSSEEFKSLMIGAGLKYSGYKIIEPKEKVHIGKK